MFLAFFLFFVSTAKGATYYWVGGTGNWNVISNWATTSGGTVHYTSIPSSTDDVIFDSNANYQVTISAGACHNMRWIGTGAARMVLSGKLDISGSLELQSGMQMYASASNTSISLTFSATTTGNTIKTNGVVIGNGSGAAFGVGVIFKGIGGGWILNDDYITTKGAAITLTAGSLNFGGKMVSIDTFTDGGTPNTLVHALNIAGSNITLFATTIPGGGTITNSGWNYSSASGLTLSAAMSMGSTITINNFTSTGVVTKINDFYNDIILLKGATTVNSIGTGETSFNHFTTYDDTFFSGNSFNYLNLLGKGSYTFTSGAVNPIIIKNALVAQPSACGGTIGLNAENSTKLANQTQFTFAAGATATVQNALIRNIATSGLIPNAVNSVDLGNNTGWSFTGTGTTYYWIEGQGNWNDVAHWSLTSGGAAGGCVPTAFDNVIFDNNSGSSVIVTIDETASCNNIIWNNAPGAVFNVNDKFFISGSLTLQPGMAMNVASITNVINFVGNTANTITTNGVTINVDSPPFRNNDIITFSRSGGSWTLMDDFNAPYASLDLNVGDLNFGGKNATIFSFKVSTPNIAGSAKLEINNSTITCKISAALGYLNYVGWSDHTSGTFAGPAISALNTSGSTIILDDSKFDTHSSIYNNIFFNGSTSSSLFDSYATVTGNTTISNLTFLGNGSIADKIQAKIGTLALSPGSSYLFPVPTTTPVSNGIVTVTTALNANGGLCSGIISIASSAEGTQSTIAATGSTVNVNNAILRDIKITGSTPYVATNSTDEGNNSGWNFTAPIVHNYYWVGGDGNWNDPMHWANSSGGIPGSGCIPTASDNVFFDGGSSFVAGSTVVVDGNAYCNNMTWSGSTIPATLDVENPLSIFGSLELQSGMTLKGNTDGGTSNISYLNFTGSTPGNTIKSNGVVINIPASTQPNGLVFNGTNTASWKVLDPLTVASWVTLSGGNLNFNGQIVSMGAFTTGSGPVDKSRSLNIAGSAITLKGGLAAMAAAWNYNVSGAAALTSNETTGSIITFAIASQTITAKATDVYNNLIIKASGVSINGGIYNKVDFTGATTNSFATFNNSPVIDILTMKSGGTYSIQTGSTLTLNKVLSPNGTPCNITKINSTTNGVQANISMPSSAANFPNNIYGIDFVQMQDINAITPSSDPSRAQMKVGNNSTAENRNNTGWIIVPHTSTPVVDGLGTNRTLGCKDFPYVLTTTTFFPNPEATFKWNDNSTGDTLTVTGPGTYSVTVTYGAGCVLSASVTLSLTPNPVLSIASALPTCKEVEVILSGTGLTGSSANETYTLQSVSPANAMSGLPVIQYNDAIFHLPVGVTDATFTITDNNSGCISAPVTTGSLPALLSHAVITGGVSVLCAGSTAVSAFTADLPDGTWSVSDTAVASITAGGILTALTVPVATTENVIYTTENGCITMKEVTINPAPIINGAVTLCGGSTTTLTATGGIGTWSSQTPLIATVDGSGVVEGISAGTAQITYTLTDTGCAATYNVTINSPTLIVTVPAAVCSGTPVDLTAPAVTAGSTANLTFTYFTDAAGTTVLANPDTVTASGIYYIKGTTPEGCSAIQSVTVAVNPLPVVAISNPPAVCWPATVDITSASVTTGSTANLTYAYFSDAAGTQPLANANAITASDTYYIQGTDPVTGCSSMSSLNVIVNLQPDALFTYDAINNDNDEYTFTPISVLAGLTYAWNFGDGTTSTAAIPTHQYNVVGNYTIILTVTNPNGCTATTTEAINITKNPNVAADISVFPVNQCVVGNIFQFSSASTVAGGYSITSLTWDFGDGSPVSNDLNPSHGYAAAGTYILSLQATASNGIDTFSDNATSSIVVIATPVVNVINPASVCSNATVNITAAAVTSGSTPGLVFTYFSDSLATQPLINANAIAASGTYYIKGTTPEGCFAISPVQVTINPIPTVTTVAPAAVCSGTPVNLTLPEVTAGSTANLIFSYFTDAAGTTVLATPSAVATGGTYYIKGTTAAGCSAISSVQVTVNPIPVVNVTNPSAVCSGTSVNLTLPAVTTGSTANLTFTYFTDAAATTVLATPNAVTISGIYYIKGTTAAGCSAIQSVMVTVNPTPTVITVAPAAVCFDTALDLTLPQVTAGSTANLTFTYFTDPAGTNVLSTPSAVTTGGTYYIKGTTAAGCSAISPVQVTINPIPVVNVTEPVAVCSGTAVDLTVPAVTAGSTANLTFTYFTDAAGTAVLVTPNAVLTGGTYYIKGTTAAGCSAIIQVQVTINPIPVVNVSNPVAVCSGTPVDLTLPEITSGSTSNLTFTYFTDATGTAVLTNADAVTTDGTYYIKGTTPEGCSAISPVQVTVNPIPIVNVTDPAVTCSDTPVDLTTVTVTAGSTANLTFTYFTDITATTVLANPDAITASGTYYIQGTTIAGCSAISPVQVTVNPIPILNITNRVPVCSGTSVDLTAAAVTADSTSNLTFTYFTDAAGTTVLANPNVVTASGTYYIRGTTAFGCSVISPVQVTVNPTPTLIATAPSAVCSGKFVDLTTAAVTAGSTSNLTFTYFTDAAGTAVLSNPDAVTAGGIYYIKGSTPEGCSVIQSVAVTINPLPVVAIINPAAVCWPATVDLTSALITTGSTANLTYAYFSDAAGTQPLANANAITASDTYYIQGTDPATGCSTMSSVNVIVNLQPDASFTYHAVNNANDQYTFTPISTTAGMSYSWDFGDGTTSNTALPTHQYNVVGNYSIKLSATNSNGCTAITTEAITITKNPNVAADISINPVNQCFIGNTFQLTSTSTVAAGYSITDLIWDFGDGTPVSNMLNPSHTYTAPGTYIINLQATASNGVTTFSDNATSSIIVIATPIVNVTNPASVCSDNTVDITAAAVTSGSTPGLIFTYFTDVADTTVLANPDAVAVSGIYYIKGNTPEGCSAISPVQVTVNPIPLLNITNPAAVCSGTSVDLTAAAVTAGSTSNLTFTYFTDAAGTIVLTNPNAVTAGDTYYIKGTTASGCSAISPVQVTVNPTPTLIATAPSSVCSGKFVDLTTAAVTAGSTSNLTFTYFTDAAGTAVLSNPDAVTAGGIYYIKGSTPEGCSVIQSVAVTINPLPVVAIINPAAVCWPATVDLTSASITTGSTANLTYAYFSDAAGTQPLANADAIRASDTYYIQGTDPLTGCTSISSVNVIVNLLPDASFTYDAINNVNDQYTFTPISTTAGMSYSWDFGDGTTSNTALPMHQYDVVGNYTITLTVSNPSGCTATTTEAIMISKNPNVAADISVNPVNQCFIGNSFQFNSASTVAAGYSITGLIWDFGDGTPVSNILNPSHSYTAPGTYIINLQVTASNGVTTFSDSATSSIIVLVTPVVNITNPAPVCSDNTVDITAAAVTSGSTPGLIFTYFTDFAGTTVLVNPDAVTAGGTYYIKGTTAAGCSAISPVEVTVNPIPILNITNPAAVCSGTSVDLTAPAVTNGSTPNLIFNYFADAAGTVVLDNPNAVTAGDTYYIKGTTPEGCSAISPVTVAVNVLPRITVVNPSAICAGSSVNLRTAVGGASTYVYYASDQITVLTSAIVRPVSTTDYYVQGVSAEGCASVKHKITVTVNTLPAVPVISISGTTTICTGTSRTISATGTGTFQWYKDGNAIVGAIKSSYVIREAAVSDSGSYTVTVSNGLCISILSNVITLTVNNCLPQFTILKSVKDANNNGKAEPNEELTYVITVKNTGSTTIKNVSVSDAVPTKTAYVSGGTFNAGIVNFAANNLAVGASISFNFKVKVVSDLTGVSAISNMATGSGDGTVVPSTPEDPNNPGNPDPKCTGSCSTDITTNAISSIAVIKRAVFVDENNDGFAQVGETIKYSFEVKNTGDTPLTDIFITDNLSGLVLIGSPFSLAPGQINSTNFTASYAITKVDIDAGFIINQALAEGTTPSGAKIIALSDNDNFIDENPTVIEIVAQDCVIKVFNAVSLNEDGINDEFRIQGLECYPNNSVEIYNRWGVRVFETSGYGANGNVFKGYSDGRSTIGRGKRLPDGTYFYILKYLDETLHEMHDKSGYLYITK
ncbi:hypothetical protein B0A65_01390 [Flavobacterium frigidimaris]|uniref:Gliding motility-associated C-terminal domain-containing protein n=2 Tax=Flavobacterium frigidimaris TaxID=262320 RepID=A0ABX4BVF2_FLAFR|nr:hypothetical protein B0A65_01390 [Flavobacterium frigidimaris]